MGLFGKKIEEFEMPKSTLKEVEEEDSEFELTIFYSNGEQTNFDIPKRCKQSIIDLVEKVGKGDIKFAGLDLGDGDKLFISTEMVNNSYIFVGD